MQPWGSKERKTRGKAHTFKVKSLSSVALAHGRACECSGEAGKVQFQAE